MALERGHDHISSSTEAAVRPRAPPLSLLASMAMLGTMAITLYVPALPALTSGLGATAGAAQLTMTVYLAGFALAQLVCGPLSDRIGRRPVALGGLSIFVLASVLAALSVSIEMLIVARLIQAVGACTGAVLVRASVRDTRTGPEVARALAAITSVLALAPTLGLAIGGLCQELLGWRGCFLLLASLGLAVLIWSKRSLAETFRKSDVLLRPINVLNDYVGLFRDRVFVANVVCGSAMGAGILVWHSGSAFLFVTEIGLSPGIFGLLGVVTGMAYFGGAMKAWRSAGKVAPVRVALQGSGLAGLGGAAFLALMLAGLMDTIAIVAAIILFAFGLGLVNATTAGAAMARHSRAAGTASSVVGFTNMASSALATSLLAIVGPRSPVALAGFMAALALLAVSSCRWQREHRNSGSS